MKFRTIPQPATRSNVAWHQPTPSGCDTVVCCFLGISNSQDLVAYQELVSLLRGQCLSACCELSINTHQRADGAVEVIARTSLPVAQVSVITARITRRYRDFIVAVKGVRPPVVVSTKPVTSTLLNLRVKDGN